MSVPQAAVQLSRAYPQKSSSFMGRLATLCGIQHAHTNPMLIDILYPCRKKSSLAFLERVS